MDDFPLYFASSKHRCPLPHIIGYTIYSIYIHIYLSISQKISHNIAPFSCLYPHYNFWILNLTPIKGTTSYDCPQNLHISRQKRMTSHLPIANFPLNLGIFLGMICWEAACRCFRHSPGMLQGPQAQKTIPKWLNFSDLSGGWVNFGYMCF